MSGSNAQPGGTDGPSERTPLLPSRRSTQENGRNTSDSETVALPGPHVGTVAAGIKLEDLATFDIDRLYPVVLQSRPARVAFALCVLFHYRKSITGSTASRGRDVWTQWREKVQFTAGIRDLDSLALRVWSDYLEDAGDADELAEVLWSAFPVDVYSICTVRVIDFLDAGHAPDDLTSHPLIHLSLADTWKYGRPSTREGDSSVSTLLRFIDRCCAPRALYIVDLAIHFAYLWVLYAFVNRTTNLGLARHVFILLYSLSKLAPSRSSSTIPPLLVLISFLSWFPDTPRFGTAALSGVLTALYWEVILLHFPNQQNSPLFLLPPKQVLPLAVLPWRGVRALLAPPLFFLPGYIFSLMLLSGTLQPWGLNAWNLADTFAFVGGPTDTQITFMYLLLTVLVLMGLTLTYTLIVNPYLAIYREADPEPWDRYTKSVGLEARRAFIRTVRLYGSENYIPAPLNLLQLVLIRIPLVILALLRKPAAAKKIAAVDKALWRVTVGPLGVLVSALWLWHLRTN